MSRIPSPPTTTKKNLTRHPVSDERIQINIRVSVEDQIDIKTGAAKSRMKINEYLAAAARYYHDNIVGRD